MTHADNQGLREAGDFGDAMKCDVRASPIANWRSARCGRKGLTAAGPGRAAAAAAA